MYLLRKSINIAREQGLIELTKRVIAFSSNFGILFLFHYIIGGIYTKTIRKALPEIGAFDLNGVLVPGKRKYDQLTPNRFYCPPGDRPDYESTEVDGVINYVDESDDVLVIGGGFGVTAVHAASNTTGEVTVIEANRERYENLSEIFELNGVSDRVVPLFGYLGALHINMNVPDIPMIPYQSVPLADVWDMDCEGAEIEILQNLPYNPSTILVETHDNHHKVVKLLEDVGYEIQEIIDDGIGQSPVCTHIRATAN